MRVRSAITKASGRYSAREVESARVVSNDLSPLVLTFSSTRRFNRIGYRAILLLVVGHRDRRFLRVSRRSARDRDDETVLKGFPATRRIIIERRHREADYLPSRHAMFSSRGALFAIIAADNLPRHDAALIESCARSSRRSATLASHFVRGSYLCLRSTSGTFLGERHRSRG